MPVEREFHMLGYPIYGRLLNYTVSRTPSSKMWRHVGLVRTDVSEEHVASMFRVDKSSSEEK
jgi:hypothetical protein